MAERISLADVLANITEELHKAQDAAKARGFATMQFEECELEFAIEAEHKGEAGIKVWVVDLGGGVKRTESNTIRLKFKTIPAKTVQVPQVSVDAPGPELKKQVNPAQ
jgi:hypothetical protein